MVLGNGIVVGLKDNHGKPLPEKSLEVEEPRAFRSRLISAVPGTHLTVCFSVQDHFHWKEADALLIAIAYDDGHDERLGKNAFTQAYAIRRSENAVGEYDFSTVAIWDNEQSNQNSHAYRVPNISDEGKSSASPKSDSSLPSQASRMKISDPIHPSRTQT